MCLNRKNPKLGQMLDTKLTHCQSSWTYTSIYAYILQICKYTSKILPNIGPNIRHMSMLTLNYKKWINKPQSSHINFLMAIGLIAQAKTFRR